MKRFLTLLTATLALCGALCISASASNYDAVADDLASIGIFRGTASGGYELDRAPTRSEAAIMLVRLYGAEAEAKSAYESGTIKHPFTDVSASASPYVAWLYTNNIANGTSATTFGSANPCSAKNYVVFLLRALGYQDGTDFQYADALEFATLHGLFDLSMVSGDFLRDNLASLTYQALACPVKGSETYLLKSLIEKGSINADDAKAITEKIETYKTLAGVGSSLSTGIDTDIKMDMDMDTVMSGTVSGAPIDEKDSASVTATGNVKVLLSDDAMELAMELTAKVDEESETMNMWLKDNWMYMQADGESVKVPLGDEFGEMMDSLMNMPANTQANISTMLPYIESISSKTSGRNTVYTVTLGKSFEGLFDSVMELLQPYLAEAGVSAAGMDISIQKLSYTYTVNSKGELTKVDASAAMKMGMELTMDEENKISNSVSMDMSIEMEIKASGKDVKITYPDFSGFEEVIGGADESTAA